MAKLTHFRFLLAGFHLTLLARIGSNKHINLMARSLLDDLLARSLLHLQAGSPGRAAPVEMEGR
jgi:hypothetical protein